MTRKEKGTVSRGPMGAKKEETQKQKTAKEEPVKGGRESQREREGCTAPQKKGGTTIGKYKGKKKIKNPRLSNKGTGNVSRGKRLSLFNKKAKAERPRGRGNGRRSGKVTGLIQGERKERPQIENRALCEGERGEGPLRRDGQAGRVVSVAEENYIFGKDSMRVDLRKRSMGDRKS